MSLVDTNVVSMFLHREVETRYPKLHQVVWDLILGEGLAISFVTLFELRRGIEDLIRRGQGRRKLVRLEKFLLSVEVLGLDSAGGGGWNLAARFWADARAQKPAIVFSDADLLIAATAAFHGREFLTCEPGLADGLDRIGFPTGVRVLERA
jgi:predicted nucleic acid-binding protein